MFRIIKFSHPDIYFKIKPKQMLIPQGINIKFLTTLNTARCSNDATNVDLIAVKTQLKLYTNRFDRSTILTIFVLTWLQLVAFWLTLKKYPKPSILSLLGTNHDYAVALLIAIWRAEAKKRGELAPGKPGWPLSEFGPQEGPEHLFLESGPKNEAALLKLKMKWKNALTYEDVPKPTLDPMLDPSSAFPPCSGWCSIGIDRGNWTNELGRSTFFPGGRQP